MSGKRCHGKIAELNLNCGLTRNLYLHFREYGCAGQFLPLWLPFHPIDFWGERSIDLINRPHRICRQAVTRAAVLFGESSGLSLGWLGIGSPRRGFFFVCNPQPRDEEQITEETHDYHHDQLRGVDDEGDVCAERTGHLFGHA